MTPVRYRFNLPGIPVSNLLIKFHLRREKNVGKHVVCICALDGTRPPVRFDFNAGGHFRGPRGNCRGRFGRKLLRPDTDALDQLSGRCRIDSPDLSGRGGSRSGCHPQEFLVEYRDRHCRVCRSVFRCSALYPLRVRMVLAAGADRRTGPVNYVRGRGLCGDDGKRDEQHRTGQDYPGCLFYQ
ncbi:MAG: hypothetical protein A4E66_02301 [Syntrophus sp. PtaB.Bin001]|nr:MAG: hypothetical protein A4E66_02301 [Syntrophus sp. PtaB.Bin001]